MGASGVELERAEVKVGTRTYVVRELTHAEHRAVQGFKGAEMPAHICAAGILEPRRFTVEELADMPARVVAACTDKILELSGMGDAEKKA